MRKSIVIPVLAAVLFAVWGAASFVASNRHEKAALFFAERLHEIGSEETVVLDDISYRVHSGVIAGLSPADKDTRYRILSLAYLKELTTRSPFVALSGTDPGKLRDALSELRATAAELSAVQESSGDDVSSALYPLLFLDELADTEQARLAFLASGRDADAADYAQKLARATDTYVRYITTFKRAFERAVPASARPYATERDIVSREGTLEALDTLSAAMEKTRSRIEKRARCVRGEVAQCNTNDEAFAALQPVPSSAYRSSQALALAEGVRTMFKSLDVHIPSDDNPLISLAESSCIRGDAGAGAVFVLSELGVLYVGDVRLLRTEVYKEVPFFKYFYDRGILYTPVQPFTYYKCPEVADDVGRVLAVRAVRTFARETPLSMLATSSEARILRTLEDKLSSPRVVYESDVSEYLASAQTIAAHRASPLTETVASLSLQMRDRSAGLDEVVRSISRTERKNLSLTQKGVQTELTPPYLFFVRSGFPSLLLAGNMSATGQKRQLFPSNDIPFSEQPFISFSSLDDSATLAEAKKGMKFFYDLHK